MPGRPCIVCREPARLGRVCDGCRDENKRERPRPPRPAKPDEPLDAGVFTRWLQKRLDRMVEEHEREAKLVGMTARNRAHTRLAEQLGVDGSTLARYLKQQDGSRRPVDFYERAEIEQVLHDTDAELWQVYGDIDDGIPRDSRGRSLVNRRGRPSLIPDEQVRAAWILHDRAGLSLREIGRLKWEDWGYSSAHSAACALSSAFRHLGFDAKPNTHALVTACTTHGKAPRYLTPGSEGYEEWRALVAQQRRDRGEVRGVKCIGVRLQYPRKGAPCQLFARAGSDYCRHHDPELREEILATTKSARAHLPRAA